MNEDSVPEGGTVRRRGGIAIGCAGALAVVGIPAVAACWVVSLASGSYQFDALGPAFVVFLATLVATTGIAIATLWMRRHTRGRAVAGVVAILLVAGAGTVVVTETRNDAPDGSAFDENYRQAADRVTNEVETALEQTLPGRWTAWEDGHIQFAPPLVGCVDVFGRTRGAGTGSAVWWLYGEPTQSELEALRQQLASGQTEFRVERRGDPFVPWNVESTFLITVREDGEEWRLDASLPCLQLR